MAIIDGFDMGSDSSINWLERKHRFIGLHGQWHQATVMLQLSQKIRIVQNTGNRAGAGFIEHGTTIDWGYLIHPPLVGFYWTIIPHPMLHDDVTYWGHPTRR